MSYHECLQSGLIRAAGLGDGGVGVDGSAGVRVSGRHEEAGATAARLNGQPEVDGCGDWDS